ncbi:unnamed protein product [Prunus armeniaca]|uniref:UTP23 sensor motif region domain-containing protein n=1 Tax=Prunus armeniaca TaxID=36596 RepID=A0A6J5UZ10_PRUAR|nr:unnamed protein product [Prunus armeniaca]
MRVKKQRRHRKIVRFYTACYGLRQPYKVLCDVNFVHHLVVNRITPADKALSNILGAPVMLFTTKCAISELKKQDLRHVPSHSQALEAAESLITARCDHERAMSADDCIMDIIGQNNPEHFFVATQHADLREKILKIPGVPAIYALRTALFLESPSAAQRQFVKTSEEQRLHMTDLEYKMLTKGTNNMSTSHQEKDRSDEDGFGDQNLEVQAVAKKHTARKGLGVKDKVQFKRKKAKGPNPLSCKKKKTLKNPDLHSVQERKDGDATLRSRKKRNRLRKSKRPVEADGLPRSLNYSLWDKYWDFEPDSWLGSYADHKIPKTHLPKSLELLPYPNNALIKQYIVEYYILGDLMSYREQRTRIAADYGLRSLEEQG